MIVFCRLYRNARLKDQGDGTVMPPPPSDTNFDIPPRFTDMILYDSGRDGNRVLMFGSDDLFDGLARARLWLADGTFKVVPSIFFQLYTIHFELASGNNPVAVYCLVQNKDRPTYDILLLQRLKILIPTANPQRILVDFETAAMSAFHAAYPNAVISGCYFHLCQSVLRKLTDVGMKQAYESDNAVRGAVRCLAALALVPSWMDSRRISKSRRRIFFYLLFRKYWIL